MLVSARAPRAAGSPAAAPRLELLGHVDPSGGESADVWGHNGYAYLSSYRAPSCPGLGVRVYRLANPRQPRLVSTFADKGSEPALEGTDTEKTIVKAVKTPSFKGDLAVTGVQSCTATAFHGFGLYDVTNPAKPKRLSLLATKLAGAHELWLQAKGSRAYVYVAVPASEYGTSADYDSTTHTVKTPGIPDFQIYDVTNPRRPVYVGGWGAFKSLGINPLAASSTRGISRGSFVHSVITNPAGTRAYLSYWDTGTVILDITKPSSPRFVGRTVFTGAAEGDAHSAALAKNGKILIETHESPRANAPTIYDISNARKPRRLADIRLPASIPVTDGGVFGGVHDPKVLGNRAYFSWYRQGIVVADITKPAAPKFVAQFVPPTPSPQVWGVYATKSYVLASDMNSGLWVLRFQPGSS
jgi:hypothetical protein